MLSVDIQGERFAFYYCSCIFFNVSGDNILSKWDTTEVSLTNCFHLSKAISIDGFSEKAVAFWIRSRRVPHKEQPEGQ